MQKEAAEELVDRQRHDPLFVAVRGVPPTEADLAVRERNESAVGDADAVGVRAKIAHNVLRSAEWPFGVNDPIMTEEASEPGSEVAWLYQV